MRNLLYHDFFILLIILSKKRSEGIDISFKQTEFAKDKKRYKNGKLLVF